MISGRQVKDIVAHIFGNPTGFEVPVGLFMVSPAVYGIEDIPSTVTLTGSISPNDGTDISWHLKDGDGNVIQSGSDLQMNYTLPAVPQTIGSTTYQWQIYYQDANDNTQSIILVTNVTVMASFKIGQLPTPADNIVIATDLLPQWESSFESKIQEDIINLFTYEQTAMGRIVFIIPHSYGTNFTIKDNTDDDIMSLVNVIQDPVNQRAIVVSQNPWGPATYQFKIVF